MLLVALLIVLSSCQKKAEVEQAPAEQAVKPAAAEVPAVQPVVEAPAKAQPGNVSCNEHDSWFGDTSLKHCLAGPSQGASTTG